MLFLILFQGRMILGKNNIEGSYEFGYIWLSSLMLWAGCAVQLQQEKSKDKVDQCSNNLTLLHYIDHSN